MPERIQRKRTKGWQMPENTVSVTRPGRWGNPFSVAVYGQQRALELYRMWLDGEWDADMHEAAENYERRWGFPSKQLIRLMLAGKNLACFCAEGEPCHADILIRIAND